MAGGGFKGGAVVGATDGRGEEVKDRPVSPAELISSVYTLLGLDPDAKLPNPEGIDARLVPPAADGARTGGRLTEIM